jgi:hypothetical protein
MKKPHFRIELIQNDEGFWNVKVWDENERWIYSQIVDFGDDMKTTAREAGITLVQRVNGAATYTVEEHAVSSSDKNRQ